MMTAHVYGGWFYVHRIQHRRADDPRYRREHAGTPASMVHWSTRLSGLAIVVACDAMYAPITIVTCLGQRPCCIGTRAQRKRHTSVVSSPRSLILLCTSQWYRFPGVHPRCVTASGSISTRSTSKPTALTSRMAERKASSNERAARWKCIWGTPAIVDRVPSLQQP